MTRRVMNMNVERWKRGRTKKRWIDCVRQDMRGEKTHGALTPYKLGQGKNEVENIIINNYDLSSPNLFYFISNCITYFLCLTCM
jgi:hypothetical protein